MNYIFNIPLILLSLHTKFKRLGVGYNFLRLKDDKNLYLRHKVTNIFELW